MIAAGAAFPGLNGNEVGDELIYISVVRYGK